MRVRYSPPAIGGFVLRAAEWGWDGECAKRSPAQMRTRTQTTTPAVRLELALDIYNGHK